MARKQELRRANQRATKDIGPKRKFSGQLIRQLSRQIVARQNRDYNELKDAQDEVRNILRRIKEYNQGKSVGDLVIIVPSAIKKQVELNMLPQYRALVGASKQKRGEIMRNNKIFPGE